MRTLVLPAAAGALMLLAAAPAGAHEPGPAPAREAPRIDYRGDMAADDDVAYGGRWVGRWEGEDGRTYEGEYRGRWRDTPPPEARHEHDPDHERWAHHGGPGAPYPAPGHDGPPPPPGAWGPPPPGGGYYAPGWYYPPPTVTTVTLPQGCCCQPREVVTETVTYETVRVPAPRRSKLVHRPTKLIERK
jgi:hypothetical protein